MLTLAHDLRAAWRSMRSTPGPMLAAALILALGTGANTAVLATTYGVLLRPLPYPDASRLAVMSVRVSDGTETSFLRADIDGLVRGLTTVEEAAGYADRELTVQHDGSARLLRVTEVTSRFFDVLGMPSASGRTRFDASAGAEVVLGDQFARTLAADGNVLGRALRIASSVHTVSGVMPPRFGFPASEVDAWAFQPVPPPPPMNPAGRAIEWPRYRLLVRVKPGVSLDNLRDDATRVLGATRGERFGKPGAAGPSVRFVEEAVSGSMRPALLVAVAASTLVLLVTCANVALLLLGLQAKRAREWALRLALGASTHRLVRATFAESALLALAGSVLGVGVALVLVDVFGRVAAGQLPRLHEVQLDRPVLVAAVAVSALVAIACGMAPALAVARRDLLAIFRGAPTASPVTRRLQSSLIVAQLALSFVLVTGTGLLARTVLQLADDDGGIEPANAVAARLVLNDDTIADAKTRGPMLRSLLERVRAMPGVQAAGVGGNLPPTVVPARIFISVQRETGNDVKALSLASATPGYLEALGVRLASGRLIEDGDDGRDTLPVLLSESAARFFSPGKDPTGLEIANWLPRIVRKTERMRVVGIVDDVKYNGLDAPPPATVYVPWSELPSGTSYLLVRSALDATQLAPALRQAIREMDSAIAAPDVRSLEEHMARSIANRRMRVLPAAGFAGLALAVSLVGLTATLSRAVHERRRELAIRTAVGASPARLTRLVLGDGLRLTAIGLIVGAGLAFASAGSLAHLLYGVGPYDPVTFAAVSVLLVTAALVSSLIPAWRAAKAEPVVLLRAE